MPESKWLKFEEVAQPSASKKRITKIWNVQSTSLVSIQLGHIKWYTRWRKYSFFPNRHLDLVFDTACLRDIANFCEARTDTQKAARNERLKNKGQRPIVKPDPNIISASCQRRCHSELSRSRPPVKALSAGNVECSMAKCGCTCHTL